MDPNVGLIILILYPIVLIGAIYLFGKYSKNPD
jgi:hypothetical protein